MKIVEYDTRYCGRGYPSLTVRQILEGPNSHPRSDPLPVSQLMETIILEAGWPTEWAFTHKTEPKYPQRYVVFRKLEKQLTAIEWVLGGKFAGKSILDLGCGAKSGTVESKTDPGYFEPWLARVLHHLGVKIVGIDIANLKNESFPSHRLDLLEPNTLKIFPDQSLDLVHSSALYSSPELQERLEGHGWDGSLTAATRLINILQPQIERILKPTGCYLFREDTRYLTEKEPSRSKVSPLEKFSPRIRLEDLIGC